jgi:TolB protein
VAANQLVLADADGTNPTVLLTASGDIPLLDGVDWFPDGSGVIFAGGYKPDRHLNINQPLDTAPFPIFTQPTSDNIQPAWSPNTAGWLAFISAVGGHRKLFVMKEDGSVIYQLTDGTTYESYPSWLSGGSKIIFASEEANLANLYSLDVSWLVGAMPNPMPAPVKLPNQAGIIKKASPHYSPEKNWVVYSALDANNHRRIFVVSTDTYGSTRLQLGGETNSNESDPAWSPDGKTAIFISDRAGNPDIYTMDMAFLYNRNPENNVPAPKILNGATTTAFEASPHYSPDGSQIVFIRRIGP